MTEKRTTKGSDQPWCKYTAALGPKGRFACKEPTPFCSNMGDFFCINVALSNKKSTVHHISVQNIP